MACGAHVTDAAAAYGDHIRDKLQVPQGGFEKKYPGDNGILSKLSIIQETPEKRVRMAHLAIVGSHSVNGVAELHSRILKEDMFREFSSIFPGKFINVTNGITQRRWLLQSNPGLSSLISSKIGQNGLPTSMS